MGCSASSSFLFGEYINDYVAINLVVDIEFAWVKKQCAMCHTAMACNKPRQQKQRHPQLPVARFVCSNLVHPPSPPAPGTVLPSTLSNGANALHDGFHAVQ